MTAAGSTALTMSISASAPTVTAGERLHLDAGPVGGARRDRDVDAVVVDRQVDDDAVQADRVAQRDQVRRALRALDRGDPGDGQRVALGHGPVAQRRDGGGGQQHPAGRGRASARSRPCRLTSTIRA